MIGEPTIHEDELSQGKEKERIIIDNNNNNNNPVEVVKVFGFTDNNTTPEKEVENKILCLENDGSVIQGITSESITKIQSELITDKTKAVTNNNNNGTGESQKGREKRDEDGEVQTFDGLEKCIEWLSHHPNTHNTTLNIGESMMTTTTTTKTADDGFMKQVIKKELYHYRQKSVRDWVNTLPENKTSKYVDESATTFAHFNDNAKLKDELLYHENALTEPVTQKDSLSLISQEIMRTKLPKTIILSDYGFHNSNNNNKNGQILHNVVEEDCNDQNENENINIDNNNDSIDQSPKFNFKVYRTAINKSKIRRDGTKIRQPHYIIRWIIRLPLARNCLKHKTGRIGKRRSKSDESFPTIESFTVVSKVDLEGKEMMRRIVETEGQDVETVRTEVNIIINQMKDDDVNLENSVSADNSPVPLQQHPSIQSLTAVSNNEGGDKTRKNFKHLNRNTIKHKKNRKKGKYRNNKLTEDDYKRNEDGGDDTNDQEHKKDSDNNSDEIERLTSLLLKTPKSTMRTIFSLKKEQISPQVSVPQTLLQRVGQQVQGFLDRISNLRHGSFGKRTNRIIPVATTSNSSRANNTISTAQQQRVHALKFLGKIRKILPKNNSGNNYYGTNGRNNNNNDNNNNKPTPSPITTNLVNTTTTTTTTSINGNLIQSDNTSIPNSNTSLASSHVNFNSTNTEIVPIEIIQHDVEKSHSPSENPVPPEM